IPVVFYTGVFADQQVLPLARACGVTHVLSKDQEPEAILAALGEALRLGASPVSPTADTDFDRTHCRLLNEALCDKALELEATQERMAAIVGFSQQLGQATAPEKLLDSFCHTARHILAARYAFLGLRGDDGQAPQRFRTSGLDLQVAAQIGLETAGPALLRRLLAERLS